MPSFGDVGSDMLGGVREAGSRRVKATFCKNIATSRAVAIHASQAGSHPGAVVWRFPRSATRNPDRVGGTPRQPMTRARVARRALAASLLLCRLRWTPVADFPIYLFIFIVFLNRYVFGFYLTILRGKSGKVRTFAEHVMAERGVRHGRVVVVPTDTLAKPHGGHDARPRRASRDSTGI